MPWIGTWRVVLVLCALIPRSTGRKTALVWTKQLIYLFPSRSSIASAISLALVPIINPKTSCKYLGHVPSRVYSALKVQRAIRASLRIRSESSSKALLTRKHLPADIGQASPSVGLLVAGSYRLNFLPFWNLGLWIKTDFITNIQRMIRARPCS